MNVFNITGRISRDLELRKTNNGKDVLDVSIAITNGKDDTTFLTITTFNKVAENISKYCKKGDTLGFEGIIKNHNWEDKNGNKHYDYSFLANRVEFLNIKKDNNDSQNNNDESQELPTNENNVIYTEDIAITDDDLPF